VRQALSVVFSLEGYRVSGFADGASFVAATRARLPACVLLDVKMPDRSGLDLLKEMRAETYAAPVFMISGHADIPTAVEAIRNGAFDFIEKPFQAETVLAQVNAAIAAYAQRRQNAGSSASRSLSFSGIDLLTARECEVLDQIARGCSSKEVGRVLGISPRTIEVHRAHIMEKLGARNAADLVRIALTQRRS
jgi:FixJ family two-component response regulator